jgi:uncharacterized damage-inducible protein DinB
MSEIRRIASQLRRSFDGEAWHGPGVMELLRGVTAAQAVAKPLKGAHSIWEITLHIHAWEAEVLRRLNGESRDLSGDANWPAVMDTSEAAWKRCVEALESGHTALRDRVKSLTDEHLSETVPGQPYDVYFMLHGVIQHGLYHAGQIGMLKSALERSG